MSTPPPVFLSLGAVLLAVGVGLEAWHAHGLRSSLEPESWQAVGRAIHQQELAGLGLVVVGLLGLTGWLPVATGAAFLVSGLLFSGSVYAKHLGGIEGATAVAPTGGMLHILAWLLVAALAWQRTRG